MVKKTMDNKRGQSKFDLHFPRTAQKKGQVTIFIILAILIVSVLLVFMLYVKPKIFPAQRGKLNIESCVKSTIGQAITELSATSGAINPESGYLYNGKKIQYFCYTNKFYKPCVNQRPFIKTSFEKDLKDYVRNDIIDCYTSSKSELQKKGYTISNSDPTIDVSVQPGNVLVVFNTNIVVSQDDAKEVYSNFSVTVPSQIYGTLVIAQRIISEEIKNGDTDTSYLMLLYPDYVIRKMKMGDGTKIYTIEEPSSETKFQFASKSWVFPAGYADQNYK